MRRMRVQSGLRSALLALALGAWAALDVRADPILRNVGYSTSGTIGSDGVNGSGAVGFNGVAHGWLNVPSTFSLGTFQALDLPEGKSTTYTNTPFDITFLSDQTVPIVLAGVLNGTVSGPNQSSLVATFQKIHYNVAILAPGPDTSVSSDPFAAYPIQDNPTMTLQLNGISQTITFSLVDAKPGLAPSALNGGLTTALGQLTIEGAVPEPASAAVFLMALAGLGLKRRLRRTR